MARMIVVSPGQSKSKGGEGAAIGNVFRKSWFLTRPGLPIPGAKRPKLFENTAKMGRCSERAVAPVAYHLRNKPLFRLLNRQHPLPAASAFNQALCRNFEANRHRSRAALAKTWRRFFLPKPDARSGDATPKRRFPAVQPPEINGVPVGTAPATKGKMPC